MPKDHSAVGVTHAHVCEGQAVRFLIRPLGQKTSSDIISRDSESREKGSRYCGEGAQKDQTWCVGVHTGSRSTCVLDTFGSANLGRFLVE